METAQSKKWSLKKKFGIAMLGLAVLANGSNMVTNAMLTPELLAWGTVDELVGGEKGTLEFNVKKYLLAPVMMPAVIWFAGNMGDYHPRKDSVVDATPTMIAVQAFSRTINTLPRNSAVDAVVVGTMVGAMATQMVLGAPGSVVGGLIGVAIYKVSGSPQESVPQP